MCSNSIALNAMASKTVLSITCKDLGACDNGETLGPVVQFLVHCVKTRHSDMV